MFAGLTLFGTAILYAFEGRLGGFGGLVFGELDAYLSVADSRFFTLMRAAWSAGEVIRAASSAPRVAFVRHLPGGLGVATVAACTVFAAISGSSVATALTIGAAAIPLMVRYRYPPRVAYGVVAAGGTLGVLIPPSGPMVLYGVVSDTSIGALFMAGVVPGLMLAMIFAIYCMSAARFGSKAMAREPRASWPESSRRCAARSGRCSCRCSCSAACTSACSRRPKPLRSAHSARC